MAVAMGAITVAIVLFFCKILLSQSMMGVPEYWYQENCCKTGMELEAVRDGLVGRRV
jgi:hypothetical protein